MECGSEASAPLKLTLQHSKQVCVRLTPRPRCGRGAGGEGNKTVKSPRNCPKFPQNRPSPLDIRAKMCYTMDVNGATPEEPP